MTPEELRTIDDIKTIINDFGRKIDILATLIGEMKTEIAIMGAWRAMHEKQDDIHAESYNKLKSRMDRLESWQLKAIGAFGVVLFIATILSQLFISGK